MTDGVWQELRDAWRYNTPICRMSARANALYFGLVVAFIVFFVVVALILT